MTYYYNFNKTDFEGYLEEYKELLNIEKKLDNLSRENKFASNYDEYRQYMKQIQNYNYDNNIEYARIFANTKEELVEETKKYIKELNYFDKECDDEDDISEFERALQKAEFRFIGQGYYDIYLFCGELGVYRIDEVLRIILDAEMMRIQNIDEVWEYICEHLDEDKD